MQKRSISNKRSISYKMTTVADTVTATAGKDLGVFIYDTIVILGLVIYIARKINYTDETSKVLAKFDIIWKNRKQKSIVDIAIEFIVTMYSIAEYMIGIGLVLLFVLSYSELFTNNITAKITLHLMTIVFIAVSSTNKFFKTYKCTKVNVYGTYDTYSSTTYDKHNMHHCNVYEAKGEHSCPYVEFKCVSTDGTNQTKTLQTLYRGGPGQLYNSNSYAYNLATNSSYYNERDSYVTDRINKEHLENYKMILKECTWLECLGVIILTNVNLVLGIGIIILLLPPLFM